MTRQESKPGVLGHTLAVIASVLTIVGMWAYTERMMLQKRQWADFGTELSQAEELQITLADLFVNYGYIIAPLAFVIVYGFILMVASAANPTRRQTPSE